jgi:carbonic anhydrase
MKNQRVNDERIASASEQSLLQGYRRFRQHYFHDHPELYETLVKEGQKPRMVVIACCDARVDPAIMLATAPGEVFVVRNVANLVPPYEPDHHYHGTSAALEFAVCQLDVPHVVILGHSGCGGIRRALEQALKAKDVDDYKKSSYEEETKMSFLDQWMALSAPAINHVLCDKSYKNSDMEFSASLVDECAKASLCQSLDHLRTFPWLVEREENSILQIHAWFFDMATGTLMAYDKEGDSFYPLLP